MAPHSSTLAWKIPWTEEPGRLQSTGSLRVGHNWVTSLSLFTFMHWRRKWQPTPVFLPGESRGGGAWWAAIYGVAQSRTRLTRLSSSRHTHPRKSSWGDAITQFNFFLTLFQVYQILFTLGKNACSFSTDVFSFLPLTTVFSAAAVRALRFTKLRKPLATWSHFISCVLNRSFAKISFEDTIFQHELWKILSYFGNQQVTALT